MGITGLVLSGVWITFWVYWFVTAFLMRSSYKRMQSSGSVLLLIILVVAIWSIVTELGPSPAMHLIPENTGTELAGLSITILGLALAVWARVHLGRYWSARPGIKQDHQLIRTGPYRFVRNPIYTGLLVGYIGTAIVIGAFWAFVLIIFLLAAFLMRIREEEKLLLGGFGEEYEKYRREVKALIPYLF